MSATERTMVAVLAAHISEDHEAKTVVLEMLNEHDPDALIDVIYSMAGLALGLADAYADAVQLPRSAVLRHYLTGLGEYAASSP